MRDDLTRAPSRHDFARGGYALVSWADTGNLVHLDFVDEDLAVSEAMLTPQQALRLGRYLIAAARGEEDKA